MCSDSGGPLEIIDDNVNGLFFKTFDAVDLADKLILLHQDGEIKERYAITGKQKALNIFESEKQFVELKKSLEDI